MHKTEFFYPLLSVIVNIILQAFCVNDLFPAF